MAILFKGCPKCNGDMMEDSGYSHDKDVGHVCMLCGYRQVEVEPLFISCRDGIVRSTVKFRR